ncbi:MAG: M20/M25/M40 family metallo-hydrolase [Gemmatimonadota bacterium]|nr:M20/M25/M40 family metallo-hydrolase [Gemmatimonadota bacterium]
MPAALRVSAVAFGLCLCVAAPPAARSQELPVDDPVLRAMWAEGMEDSRADDIAQALMDSIGPRLTGTPQAEAANRWAVDLLETWGIEARAEPYGTWKGWNRGTTHVDLLDPRVRSLDAMLMAWSPGTRKPVEGGVVVFPELEGRAAFEAWLPSVKGKFVALAAPQPSCRPVESYEEYGQEGAAERVREERRALAEAWQARLEAPGVAPQEGIDAIEKAGALGILWSDWTGGWGARRVFALNTRLGAATRTIPALDLSCEDYGLVTRLAENGQGPRLRVDARAEMLGDVPVANVIGMIPGRELPDEYVVLSAHFDSWDGGSGATDNGTGSVTMLEAMRILARTWPEPKRTILIGLWASEEQGLNGSRAFVADHPEVIDGLQAAFNQDNGTGRISSASAMGLVGASENLAAWLARVPAEISHHIDMRLPGSPSGGGSDHAAFICGGAPTFGLGSNRWDYFSYTWHTNLDTYDKIVWEEIRNNATLVAMLAYLAAEDERVPRDRRVLSPDPRTGELRTWPACEDGERATSDRYR